MPSPGCPSVCPFGEKEPDPLLRERWECFHTALSCREGDACRPSSPPLGWGFPTAFCGAVLAKSPPSEPSRADWRPVVKLKTLSNHQNCRGEGVPCRGRGTGALTDHRGDAEARTQAVCPPVVPGRWEVHTACDPAAGLPRGVGEEGAGEG